MLEPTRLSALNAPGRRCRGYSPPCCPSGSRRRAGDLCPVEVWLGTHITTRATTHTVDANVGVEAKCDAGVIAGAATESRLADGEPGGREVGAVGIAGALAASELSIAVRTTGPLLAVGVRIASVLAVVVDARVSESCANRDLAATDRGHLDFVVACEIAATRVRSWDHGAAADATPDIDAGAIGALGRTCAWPVPAAGDDVALIVLGARACQRQPTHAMTRGAMVAIVPAVYRAVVVGLATFDADADVGR